MRDDEWQRIFMFRANVDEMDVETVDLGDELWQGVEPRFHLPPVVFGPPIAHYLLEFCELYALRPIINRLLVRPAGRGDTSAKIAELLLRNRDVEGPYRVAVTRCSKFPG